ncbi:MAG: hypothetical protein V1822_03000 [Candidatus Micrarchaeota archaeon]
MQGNNLKKGVIFTISVFILAAVLLDLSSYLAEHNARHDSYFLPPSDGEVLNSRLYELSRNTQRALGAQTSIERTSTQAIFIYNDSFPFPPNSGGDADLGAYHTFYTQVWPAQNNLSCSLDVSTPNSTGVLYLTNSGMEYRHVNSDSNSDYAQFTLPSGYEFSNINFSVYCIEPQDVSQVGYSDWSGPGTNTANISFKDNAGHSRFLSTNYDPSIDQSSSVVYQDSEANTIQTISFYLLSASKTLKISSEVNPAYLSKEDANCLWNLTIWLDYSSSEEIYYYSPISAQLSYANASYSGFIPIARK